MESPRHRRHRRNLHQAAPTAPPGKPSGRRDRNRTAISWVLWASRTKSPGSEDPLEDGVDVLEMVVEVEVGLELLVREPCAHVLVRLEKRQEIAFAGPHFHGVALYEAIGVFTRHALLGERDQHALRVDQPAK